MAIKNRLVAGALLALCVSTASAQIVDGRNYDGLLDCKNNVQWMTISYNYFHNHDKSCLFLHGEPSRQNR